MKEHQDPARDAADRRGETPGRRPYRKPRLTEYGSIAKLTQGSRTRQSDGAGGGFRRACL